MLDVSSVSDEMNGVEMLQRSANRAAVLGVDIDSTGGKSLLSSLE